jgi:hypothetical protein
MNTQAWIIVALTLVVGTGMLSLLPGELESDSGDEAVPLLHVPSEG